MKQENLYENKLKIKTKKKKKNKKNVKIKWYRVTIETFNKNALLNRTQIPKHRGLD